jgi:hypothetical protein
VSESSAKIICDSISPHDVRVTTMEVTLHRFVLAELNTHRVFSRNSASSRAVPVTKMLDRATTGHALPISWPCEQPGMQGGAELTGRGLIEAFAVWEAVRISTLGIVGRYVNDHPDPAKRLHKSVLNRLLEPFQYHTVLITSSLWENFFGLRNNPLAQPEIALPAAMMEEIYRANTPSYLDWDEWHLPLVTPAERSGAMHEDPDTLCKISAARCARVSTFQHDTGLIDISKDLGLFERLESADPMHASPLEHQCTPVPLSGSVGGNIPGYLQFRTVWEEKKGVDSYR